MRLIELFETDPAGMRAYVGIENEVRLVDAPWQEPSTTYRLGMRIRHGWAGEPARHFLAYAEATDPVGIVVIDTSDYDNLDLAWLRVFVRPEARRRGHGTAILEGALELCRQMRRPLVGTDGWDTGSTRGFAQRAGFGQKSVAVARRLTIADVPHATVQALHDEAAGRASAYELVRIKGHSPDDLLDALAEGTAAINDAPTDELEYDDEVFTAERLRRYETAQIEGGHRFYRVIARHRDTREVAGLSIVTVDVEQPAVGDQHDTSVVRAHRGHSLGLLLKSDMLRWLAVEEPGLQTIGTWNAESNDHMIGVNERLGYRVMGRALQFQRRL